jgi:hypothetical protein
MSVRRARGAPPLSQTAWTSQSATPPHAHAKKPIARGWPSRAKRSARPKRRFGLAIVELQTLCA